MPATIYEALLQLSEQQQEDNSPFVCEDYNSYRQDGYELYFGYFVDEDDELNCLLIRSKLPANDVERIFFENHPNGEYHGLVSPDDYWLWEEAENNQVEVYEDDSIEEELVDETYDKKELKELKGQIFNQLKIKSISHEEKYGQMQTVAHTVCTKCGRTKSVFLSNLIKNPAKYGSCICSEENIDAKINRANSLYDGTKVLPTNTSGYTGVSFVKTYGGEAYNKWRAYIEVDGKRAYLGDFTSKADAIKARKTAGEKGIKWYKENRNILMRDLRKRSKKYKTSKYRDRKRKTLNINFRGKSRGK